MVVAATPLRRGRLFLFDCASTAAVLPADGNLHAPLASSLRSPLAGPGAGHACPAPPLFTRRPPCKIGEHPTHITPGLAGATTDAHCYDVLPNKWSRVTLIGEPPTPKPVHVATAPCWSPSQGGIGPAGLSAEDLHVLDHTQQCPRWHSFCKIR